MLVCVAGQGFADVSVSGDGRMGIVSKDGESEIVSRIRIKFSASGTTDSGLTFGGSVRADNAAGGASGTSGSVYLSGGFGSLSMGDVDSADNAAVGQLAGVGYTGLGDHNEVGYYNSDKEMALYSYSVSGFTGFLSVGQPDNAEDNYALGASYNTDTFSVGIGYEDVDAAGTASDKTAVTVSASGTFSGVTAKAIYATEDVAVGADWESYGVSAKYTMDAVSVTGFYRQAERAGNTDYFQGIGASYSLGGGATLAGGVVNNNGQTKADLGVNFSF